MKDKNISHHHVIPRSRIKQGKQEPINNLAIVTHYEHDKYHQLFSNRTPVEILHYLVETFWNGKVEYLNEYLEEIK